MFKIKFAYIVLLFLTSVSAGCMEPGTEIGKSKIQNVFTDPNVATLAKAAANGDTKTIDELVAKGVDVNSKGKDGATPLLWALGSLNRAGVERLLEHGADPDVKLPGGSSPIYIAAGASDSEFLKMMLNHGGDPNYLHEKRKHTLLFSAIMQRNLDTIEILVDNGADINHRNSHGNTPLIFAAGLNHHHIVYRLLELGADYSITNNWGNTVTYPIENNNISTSSEGYEWRQKVIVFLRERGVEVNPRVI